MELRDFLDRLNGVRKVGSGYQALCPSHPDQRASLHVISNDTGIGLKCHAGCGTDEILQELDLPWDALFFEEPKKKSEPEMEYNYRDSDGRLLYQVLRYPNKEFRQRVPNGSTWTWSLNGVKRVPYQLPEIIEAEVDTPIFVVEGEKDAATLRAHGFLATTNSGGAKWDWPAEWRIYFEGRRVILIPDADAPGRAHMDQIGELLSPVADVYIIHLKGAKDITDWFLGGHTKEELANLAEAAELWSRNPLTISEQAPEFDFPPAPVWDGILGEIVKLIDPWTESDPVALFMEMLTMFGCAMNTAPHFNIMRSKQRGNLHICIVGKTAEGRKGTSHDIAVDLMGHVNPEFIEKRMPSSMSTGEGLIHFIRDPILAKDGKVVDEGVADKRVCVVDTEFAATTLVNVQRTGNNLAGILRQAWDNPPALHIVTKHFSESATNPHVSLIGHATPRELMQNLRTTDISAGTANRILWFMVRQSKERPTPELIIPKEVYPLLDKLNEALRFTWTNVQEVRLSKEAESVWTRIRSEVKVADDGNEQIVHFLTRAMPQIARMALILACMEMKSVIEPQHLEQAAGLFQYSRKSVEYFLQSGGVYMSPDEVRLFNLLEEMEEGEGLSRREIERALGWNGRKTREVAALLCKKQMAKEYPEPARGGRGGKPRRVLVIP